MPYKYVQAGTYLYVVLVGDRQTVVDCGGCCAPVLVQLQPDSPRLDDVSKPFWLRRVTLQDKSKLFKDKGAFVSVLRL
jgi:hypothetical protein